MMTKRDYDALMTGKQILENNQYTTPIGRSIDLASGKWDGNRAVVALYEASNIIDISNKKAVNDYLIESSIFLNRLNEKCHIDGYHFDMDDGESGKIYFGKDIEDNSLAYNTSEDEITYSQESAYFTYMMNKDQCQQRVNRMIEESLILTDNQMGISEKVNRLLVVNEGVGDKVKDGWEKFKAFINKMWNKFLEFISRTVNSDKNYLEKYKEIILKREYKANDVEVDDDYHTGITHISTFQIWSPNVEEVKQLPDGDSDEELKAVQRLVMKPYAEKSNEDFKDFCLTYFKGGSGQSVTMDKGNIRMENLFDYCYNFDKIRRSIEKNRGIMDKAGNAFIELVKQQAAQTPTTQPSNESPQITIANTTIGTKDQDGTTPYTVKYSFKDQDGTTKQETIIVKSQKNEQDFKTELDKIKTKADLEKLRNTEESNEANKSNSGQSTNVTIKRYTVNGKESDGKYKHSVTIEVNGNTETKEVKRATATPIYNNNDIVSQADFEKTFVGESYKIHGSLGLISIYEAKVIPNSGSSDNSKVKINSTASNFGNASTGRTMVRSRSGIEDTDGSGLKGLTEDQITKRVHKYTSAASTVFASILQAAETIKKDYMQIIKLHVRSYVGETDEERREGKTTAASPHNYGQAVAVGFTPEKLKEVQGAIANAGDNPTDEEKNKVLNIAHKAVTNEKGVPNKTWDSYEALKAEINSLVQQQQIQQQNQSTQTT